MYHCVWDWLSLSFTFLLANSLPFLALCIFYKASMQLISLYWLSRLVLLYEPGTVHEFSWTSMCFPPPTDQPRQTNNKQTNKSSCNQLFIFSNFIQNLYTGGPLVFEVGYHSCKKIYITKVFFQDQAMYAHTSFRGAKMCKI